MPADRQGRERDRAHYPGDGLDFRRPVMSTSARQSFVGEGNVNANGERASAMPTAPAMAPPVIDLTDEHEDENEGMSGGRDGVELTGTSAGLQAGNVSHASGGQRLPRFGRDVIDIEEHDQQHHNHGGHDFGLQQQRDLEDNDFAGLHGANFLTLPPRRSALGRVQYSTLRRPTRPPSPPQDMDEEVSYLGTRSFASAHERRPTPGPATAWLAGGRSRSRSVTPYPTGLNDAPIDLTEDAEDGDDDVLFVNARQRGGLNLDQPDGDVGTRTQAGGHERFTIGRLANMLRDRGADIGGRLAQRAQQHFNNNDRPYAGVADDELAARRIDFEARLANYREQRERDRTAARDRPQEIYYDLPWQRGRHARVRGVRADANGNIPGFQRVGWFPGAAAPPPNPRAPRPNLPDIGGMMNYGLAAFDMGYAGPARPPTPKYSPPPEPAAGFTRNPGEDEVVVCPNCGDELAVGDVEAKQEIWVNKGCGHVSRAFIKTRRRETWVADFCIGVLRRLRSASVSYQEQEGQG